MKTKLQCIQEAYTKATGLKTDDMSLITTNMVFESMDEYANQVKPKFELSPKWNEADISGILHIPDHLDKLFNKVGMQMRFVLLSGKNEIQAVADICRGAEEFFLS